MIKMLKIRTVFTFWVPYPVHPVLLTAESFVSVSAVIMMFSRILSRRAPPKLLLGGFWGGRVGELGITVSVVVLSVVPVLLHLIETVPSWLVLVTGRSGSWAIVFGWFRRLDISVIVFGCERSSPASLIWWGMFSRTFLPFRCSVFKFISWSIRMSSVGCFTRRFPWSLRTFPWFDILTMAWWSFWTRTWSPRRTLLRIWRLSPILVSSSGPATAVSRPCRSRNLCRVLQFWHQYCAFWVWLCLQSHGNKHIKIHVQCHKFKIAIHWKHPQCNPANSNLEW